jgi:hypothetical protein
MYMHKYISLLCQLKSPTSNDTPVVMSTLNTQNLSSNTILQSKKPGILGEIVYYWARKEIYKMSLRCLVVTERKKCSESKMKPTNTK